MAIAFEWNLQSNDTSGQDTEIGETDILQFAGGDGFDSPVFVGEWNESTHVKTSGGADKSETNVPNNNQFVSQDGGYGGESEVSVNGGAAEDLSGLAEDDAALKITVTEATNVTVTIPVFFSYDPGQTPADPLAGINVKAAEIGDSNFTDAEGSVSPLELADSDTPATSHDFFIVISKSPTSIGLKSDTLRFEAVIQ